MGERPTVVVAEQPAGRHRFRYKSELGPGRHVDVMLGVHSSPGARSYPTVEVPGYEGPLAVMVSLVNARDTQVHPHGLQSADARYAGAGGVLLLAARGPRVPLRNVGVVCVRRKNAGDVADAFRERRNLNVDPFRAGWEIPEHIDFDAVRLCFSVFLPEPGAAAAGWEPREPAHAHDWRRYPRALPPVLSTVVRNVARLRIVRVGAHAGSVLGGTEMFLLCEKYSGAEPEVEVVFADGAGWEAPARVLCRHRGVALVFETPRYRDPHRTQPVQVEVFLRRRDGEARSAAVPVELAPAAPPPRAPPPDYLSSKLRKPTLAAQCRAWRRGGGGGPGGPGPAAAEGMYEGGASTSPAQPLEPPPPASTGPAGRAERTRGYNYSVSPGLGTRGAPSQTSTANSDFPLPSSSNTTQATAPDVTPYSVAQPTTLSYCASSRAWPGGGGGEGPPREASMPNTIPIEPLNLPPGMSGVSANISDDFTIDADDITYEQILSFVRDMVDIQELDQSVLSDLNEL